jgi:hypothetical protein
MHLIKVIKILFLNIMDVLEEQALMDQYADTV